MLIGSALTVAIAGGCIRVHDCRPGTLRITLNLGGAANADGLLFLVAIGQNAPKTQTIVRTGHANIETVDITFPGGYSAGQIVTIEIDALVIGSVVAKVGRTLALNETCTAVSLSPQSVETEQSPPDMATTKSPQLPPDMTPPSDLATVYVASPSALWISSGGGTVTSKASVNELNLTIGGYWAVGTSAGPATRNQVTSGFFCVDSIP
jgi:hypothetical protein